MNTVAIVQARMSSTRFPGKVLAPLNGTPMIIQQLQRVTRATTVDRIVAATSSDPSDDPLAKVVAEAGYPVYRGSLTDVLDRFVGAGSEHQADVLVRITADCPLISPSVIDRVVAEFSASGADYASNTLEPTYPDGLDVEVFRTAALERIQQLPLDADEREHVTLGIYRHPELFTLHSVVDPSGDHSDLRWTVDTPEDLEFVAWVYSALADSQPEFEYTDILQLLAAHPEHSRTAAHGIRNAALLGKETGAMKGPST